MAHRRVTLAAACLAAASFGVAAPAKAEPREYHLDPSHMSIAFSADHIGYTALHGLFTAASGRFVFDEATNTLTELEATIQADSVFTGHDRRDNHLRNADFLDVENHPEIRFVMTSAEAATDTTGHIHGDLTILGVTQPVTLDVTLNRIAPYPFPANNPNHVIGVTATTTVQRSAFGMMYAVENGWVGDEIPVTIAVEAIRQD